MVKITTPDTSAAEHEATTRHAEELLEALELAYRKWVRWLMRTSTRTRAHAHTRTRTHAHTRTRAHAHTRTRRHRAMRCRRPGLHGEPATTDAQPGVVCHVTGLLKGSSACPLSRLPLDGPCTSFILAKILEMVSAPP